MVLRFVVTALAGMLADAITTNSFLKPQIHTSIPYLNEGRHLIARVGDGLAHIGGEQNANADNEESGHRQKNEL